MSGSVQLRRYLFLRQTLGREEAAEQAGLVAEEARLTGIALERGELGDIEPLDAAAEITGHEGGSVMADSEQIRTTISVNGGPEIPVDLADINAPANVPAKEAIADVIVNAHGGSIAADELRLLIERIERLAEEKKAMQDDIADVFAEAKARGYDVPTMRRILKLRKMEPQQLQEAQALLETYAAAVGLQGVLL